MSRRSKLAELRGLYNSFSYDTPLNVQSRTGDNVGVITARLDLYASTQSAEADIIEAEERAEQRGRAQDLARLLGLYYKKILTPTEFEFFATCTRSNNRTPYQIGRDMGINYEEYINAITAKHNENAQKFFMLLSACGVDARRGGFEFMPQWAQYLKEKYRVRESYKAYALQHPEWCKAKNKKWRQSPAGREWARAYLRKYYQDPEHREKKRERERLAARLRYTRNPETARAKARQYRAAHPEECRARAKRYAEAHAAEKKERRKKYYAEHKEQEIERARARYRNMTPEQYAERRARENANRRKQRAANPEKFKEKQRLYRLIHSQEMNEKRRLAYGAKKPQGARHYGKGALFMKLVKERIDAAMAMCNTFTFEFFQGALNAYGVEIENGASLQAFSKFYGALSDGLQNCLQTLYSLIVEGVPPAEILRIEQERDKERRREIEAEETSEQPEAVAI